MMKRRQDDVTITPDDGRKRKKMMAAHYLPRPVSADLLMSWCSVATLSLYVERELALNSDVSTAIKAYISIYFVKSFISSTSISLSDDALQSGEKRACSAPSIEYEMRR